MTQAITLSGGGAYGAYEVGVLKALMGGHAAVTGGEAFDPRILTGTSAGAYLAAVLLSADTESPKARAAHLERVWLDKVIDSTQSEGNSVYYLRGNPRRYLDSAWLSNAAADATFFLTDMLNRMSALATGRDPLDRRALEMFDLSALISTEPFHDLVRRTVSVDTIRRSSCLIRIAATNWKTGELAIFGNAEITLDAVLASAAIPGVFPAIRIGGDPYMDGGILMNTPLKPAIDAGAEVIHVVALDPDIAGMAISALPNTMDTIGRMLNISNSVRIETDLKLAQAVNRGLANDPVHRRVQIHVHRPRCDMGGVFGMLHFGRDRMLRLIEEGFEDAKKHDCLLNGCVL